jgi:hypothetical protein
MHLLALFHPCNDFFRRISDLRLILLPAVSPMRLPLNQAGRNGFSDFWRFSLNQGEQTLGEALTQFFEPMVASSATSFRVIMFNCVLNRVKRGRSSEIAFFSG